MKIPLLWGPTSIPDYKKPEPEPAKPIKSNIELLNEYVNARMAVLRKKALVAKDLGTSVPTLRQWLSGKSAPNARQRSLIQAITDIPCKGWPPIECQKPKRAYEDLTGRVFGDLTVKEVTGYRDGAGSIQWTCICICGSEILFSNRRLRYLQKNSPDKLHCGCKDTRRRRSH